MHLAFKVSHYKLHDKCKNCHFFGRGHTRVLEEQFSQILFQLNLFSVVIMFFKVLIHSRFLDFISFPYVFLYQFCCLQLNYFPFIAMHQASSNCKSDQ